MSGRVALVASVCVSYRVVAIGAFFRCGLFDSLLLAFLATSWSVVVAACCVRAWVCVRRDKVPRLAGK
jgi:hypothetical protein